MRSIGVMILCFFAVVWWGVGLHLSGHLSGLLLCLGVVPSLALAVAGLRAGTASAEDQRRIGRLVGWASTAEGVAMLVSANVLNWLGLGDYFFCSVAVIVGLHFVPLARLPQARIYYKLAAMLVTLGLAGCLLPMPNRDLVVGVGAALAIWTTCAFMVGIARPRRLALLA